MSILNKGVDPNEFKEEFNEKNILIHTLTCLKRSSPDNILRMFPKIYNEEKRQYIESVMIASKLFEHWKQGYYTAFKIAPETNRSLFKTSAQELVDQLFVDRDMERQEKSAIREKLWYESAEAKIRFDDYGRIVKSERLLVWATVISAAVAIVALIVAIVK